MKKVRGMIMEPIIKVEHLSKEFGQKGSGVHALNDVSLSIEKGDIYGIIGMSGAGKSTFVRCLNLLERPTSGNVYIDGKDLVSLSERELRAERMNIGMIFQHFNLLMQRSVIDNVCFPLEIAGVKKKEAREKAMEYLKIVGLEEKANAYPSQLSGGQKQRVAIARVLASDPKILLCDEATSALDNESERIVQQSLEKLAKGRTTFTIAHRLTTIKNATKILVLTDKGIEESGTHKELMQKKGIYYGLYKSYAEMTADTED